MLNRNFSKEEEKLIIKHALNFSYNETSLKDYIKSLKEIREKAKIISLLIEEIIKKKK